MSMTLSSRDSRLRRVALMLATGLLALVIAWGLGFVWFLRTIARPPALPLHADGIVALTGGAERVETALRLLAEGKADRLLLSGIGPTTELSTLARRAGIDPTPMLDRIMLGRSALSTRGNAAETADWLRQMPATSIILVTAYYHMPRALAELRPVLPGVTIYPFPVGREAAYRVSMLFLFEEYSKFLAARFGVTAWLPTREPLRGGATS
jgi:uncharacterized SAM-binding protein YcdF (DUF218 family)